MYKGNTKTIYKVKDQDDNLVICLKKDFKEKIKKFL